MKTLPLEWRRWTKRVGPATCLVVLMSLVACDRGDSQAQSEKAKGSDAETLSAEPSDEGVRPPLTSEESASEPADLKPLVGRWVRTDTPYVIEIREVRDDGAVEAAYYNPGPINVARAEAGPKQNGIELFVELRDVNYPGSTYTLTYDRTNDYLSGVYFQAVHQQNFEVAFVREQAER